MNMVRATGIAIIAFFCLVAFSLAYAEEITIYGSDEGTQVIQVPDYTETQASGKPYIENPQQPKTETWHLVSDYQGQQEDGNKAAFVKEQAEIANKQEEERIETKNRQTKKEMQNKRGGGAERPLNQYRLN